MKLHEVIDEKYTKPIPEYKEKLDGWEEIIIEDNNEGLVSLKGLSERIVVKPQYYLNGIPGAENDCKVRKTIANKLILIVNKLPKGFKLLIWDSYRSIETQQKIFDSYYCKFKLTNNLEEEKLIEYTKKFVSLPSNNKEKPSPHNTGAAVDLTICDCNENPINLGINFDEFKKEAYTRYFEEKLEKGKGLTDEEKEMLLNRRILCNIFAEEGFVNYPFEIWHKSFGDQMSSKLLNLEYAIYGGIESK